MSAPRLRVLPCDGELPGASSSWRAGHRGSPAWLPLRAESERGSQRPRCPPAAATLPRRLPRTGWGGAGSGAGAAVCRLRAWGVGRVGRGPGATDALPLPAQRPRLGRGARLRPRMHPDRRLADGRTAEVCARPRTQSCGLEGPRAREEGGRDGNPRRDGGPGHHRLLRDLGQVTCPLWAFLSQLGRPRAWTLTAGF